MTAIEKHKAKDEELLLLLQTGDKKAFDTLFLKYYPILCAYASSFVGNDEAEEIIQDIMVGIWEHKHCIHIEFSFQSYLFRTVKNRCLNHIEKNHIHESVHSVITEKYEEEQLKEENDFYTVIELSERIETAIKKLPQVYKDAFIQNRIYGKTYQEIAASLGVSAKTIDYRIQKALKYLRSELKDCL